MKRKLCKMMAVFFGLLFMCILYPGLTAMAKDDVIEIRYGSINPPEHSYSKADKLFFQKIEKETNGRVKFKAYWSGTLVTGAEGRRELITGVVDMAYLAPFYEKSGLDLTRGLTAWFRVGPSAETNVKVYWELREKFPELRDEYKGVKILAIHSAESPMRFMTTKSVSSLNDIKGMRVKVPPDAVCSVNAIGAEAVPIPMVEVYEAFQKGIVDGLFAPPEAYKSIKLAEIVKYEVSNIAFPNGIYAGRGMNMDTWNKLPPDIQKIFEENKDWYSSTIIQEIAKTDLEGRDLANKAGVKVIKFTDAEEQRFANVHEECQRKRAQDLDAKGFPGTKLIEETYRLIDLYSKK